MSSVKSDIFFMVLSGVINPFCFSCPTHLFTTLETHGFLYKSEFDYYLSCEPLSVKANNHYYINLETETEFNFGIVHGEGCVYFLDEYTDIVYNIIYGKKEIKVNKLSLRNYEGQREILLGKTQRVHRYH